MSEMKNTLYVWRFSFFFSSLFVDEQKQQIVAKIQAYVKCK